MIIGNNNINNDNFQNKLDCIKENSNNIKKTNRNINTKHYKDINNSNAMIDESISMLQDRLNKKLISYEEFIKQCDKLNKLRK